MSYQPILCCSYLTNRRAIVWHISSVMLLLVCSGEAGVRGEERNRSNAMDLLQHCLQSQGATDRISFKGTIEIFRDRLVPPDDRSRHQKLEIWFRRDGTRLDISFLFSFLDKMQESSGHRRVIVNDHYYCGVSTTKNLPLKEQWTGGVVSEAHDVQLYNQLRDLGFSGPLDGYLFDSKRLGMIMQEASDLRIGREEIIDNMPCRLVEASTPYGKVTMSLAKVKGWLPLKVTYEMSASDLDHDDKPLSESQFPRSEDQIIPIRKRIGILDRIKIQQFGNMFVPVSGRLLETFKLSQGPDVINEFIYNRTQIDLNPRFNGTDAFQIKFEENAMVTNLDQSKSGVLYLWREGKMVPAFSDFSGTAEGKWSNLSVWLVILWLVIGLALLVVSLRYVWRHKRATG